jgi:hypothetical protein
MVATTARPRVLPIFVVAAFLAVASVLVASAVVRAGAPPPACSILISSVSSPVPAESATIIVGEQAQVSGTGFTPNVTLDITVVKDGIPQATFPQGTDGSGNFILTGSFTADQVGSWTLTAVDGQVCSDVVAITVVMPTPTPEALPDAAMAPNQPPSGGLGLPMAAFLVGLVGLTAVSVRSRRPA